MSNTSLGTRIIVLFIIVAAASCALGEVLASCGVQASAFQSPIPPRPTPRPAPDCARDYYCVFLPQVAKSQSATACTPVLKSTNPAIVITERLEYGIGPDGLEQFGVHGPLVLDKSASASYWMQSRAMYDAATPGQTCTCTAPAPLGDQWCTSQLCCESE